MPKTPYASMRNTAACPFYQVDEENTAMFIQCEGFYGQNLRIVFKRKQQKRRHAAIFCECENYKQCEIYKLTLRKYEEREQ